MLEAKPTSATLRETAAEIENIEQRNKGETQEEQRRQQLQHDFDDCWRPLLEHLQTIVR
jgi:hypothetical protein